ncbi:MAG: iron-containing alcohol dehydrogenase, partial [Hydrogeniiclostridium sp.]
MLNFEYYTPTKLVFGRGTQDGVGELVRSFGGSRVLLHYGGGSAKKSGAYDQVKNALSAAGLEVIELGGVKPNPRVSLVREGIRLCRERKVDFILALGGGSVIDSAKGIAAGVYYDGDVWDFYMKRAQVGEAIPIGVVLTIPAAGSETSAGSVVTNEDGHYKRDCMGVNLIPRFAVLNPEYCFTLPDYQVGAGVSDILAHVMERYFTNTAHVDLTDRLCESTMRTVMLHAGRVLENKRDYDAWAEIMWAGTIAHCNLLGTGREQDWASHNIEHELSAQYDIAHGAGLAIIFPAWMKYVNACNRGRFVQFAVRVMGVDLSFTDPEAIVNEGIRRLEAFS